MRRKPYRPPVPIAKDTAEVLAIVDRLVKRGELDHVKPAADPPREEARGE